MAILLIGILGLGFLTNIGIALWFEVEQDYIAQELCQEKDIEDSDCEGHCVLTKKVNDSKPVTQIVLDSKLLEFLLPTTFTKQCYGKEDKTLDGVGFAVLEQPPGDVFRPPC